MQANVLEFFEQTVARLPAKLAVIDREHSVSFSELRIQALGLAATIRKNVDGCNRPIAVFLPKGKDAVVAFLAILYSANFYVPLDVNSPNVRLSTILKDLDPILVITTRAAGESLRSIGWPQEKTIFQEDTTSLISTAEEEELEVRRSSLIDTDPVYIIYTSGSTGIPKGVVIPHRGVIDYIDWARKCYGSSEVEVIGNQAPFFFDNSTLDLYLCFSSGATLILIPEELFAFPLKLMEFVRQSGITTFFWVPSVLTSVANFKILDSVELPQLRKILFAGEVMPNRTLNYWRRRLPQALFSNLYGPTEITVDCTYYVVEREFDDNESLPIGFPCRNTDVLILNEDNRKTALGETGELCVRGSCLALGYWNSSEKTNAAFVQNPLNPHYPDKIYRTGDLVYMNSHGEIIFVGRKDSQIKHQGYRIELGEIETAILAMPEIANACVLYNNADKAITLFYQPKESVTPASIRRGLSTKLAKYMLPTVFHEMNALPMTANGKIDRVSLSAQYCGEKVKVQ